MILFFLTQSTWIRAIPKGRSWPPDIVKNSCLDTEYMIQFVLGGIRIISGSLLLLSFTFRVVQRERKTDSGVGGCCFYICKGRCTLCDPTLTCELLNVFTSVSFLQKKRGFKPPWNHDVQDVRWANVLTHAYQSEQFICV